MHCSLQNYSTRNQATSFTSCQRHWYAALQHARVWMTSIHWELSFLQSLPYVPPPKARRDEMRKIVRSAAAGVAPKESFPLGDDLCDQIQRKWKFSKREIHPGRESNSTVSGPKAFGQARTLGDMHERTNWRGWETRKESGWAILTFDQRCLYYLIRYIIHFIQLDIPLHFIIPLIYRADLWFTLA